MSGGPSKSLERLKERHEKIRLQNEIAEMRLKAKVIRESRRAYEAAIPSQYRRRKNVDQRSPDAAMQFAGHRVRDIARYLDENHDLAVGILDELVNNVVGTGIVTIPTVKTRGGELAEDVNEQINAIYKDWTQAPEVTGELPWSEAQRLAARTWFRDGEMFTQHIIGGRLEHLSGFPYSLELIEPDLCPFELITQKTNVVHGIEKDAWGRPRNYHFYLQHPGDAFAQHLVTNFDTKQVPAELITHLKFIRRIRQTRGISVFHSVLIRLEDIKDAEESERIAARVAAAMCAVIKKGDASSYAPLNNDSTSRQMEFNPGMIFDNLLPGESVETIAANRPNPNMHNFRQSQLRAAAAGSGTKYSSIARDYSGTFSSQRQELVESGFSYNPLRILFTGKLIRRAHYDLIDTGIITGKIRLTKDLDLATLYDAEYRGPTMPWIDPQKEITAIKDAIDLGLTTRRAEIIKRGDDPLEVKKQREKEREEFPQQQQLALPAPSADKAKGKTEAEEETDPPAKSESEQEAA